MTPSNIPLVAIETFETLTGLHVSIHDFDNNLTPYLPKHYFFHAQAQCMAIKNGGAVDKCVLFDREFLYTHPTKHLEPRVHCCHAGIIEWSTVIYHKNKIMWIIFAGQKRNKGNLSNLILDKNYHKNKTSKHINTLPYCDQKQSELYKESLTQLALRLNDWRINQSEQKSSYANPPDAMKFKINLFIFENHKHPIKLSDLAKHLSLSESRTAHIVKTHIKKNFVEQLNEYRIQSAESLLQNTKLPISEVALKSGFNDISHFHRIFKKHKKISPKKFRSEFVKV